MTISAPPATVDSDVDTALDVLVKDIVSYNFTTVHEVSARLRFISAEPSAQQAFKDKLGAVDQKPASIPLQVKRYYLGT